MEACPLQGQRLLEVSMEQYPCFRMAASVFAFAVLVPCIAMALMPLLLLGTPVVVALLLPVVAISAGSGR